MPFLSKAEAVGCKVTGRFLNGDQTPVTETLQFTPERSGAHGGTVYTKTVVFVKPGADGTFSVALAPSAAVGLWLCQGSDIRLVLNVPDAKTARLEDLIVS